MTASSSFYNLFGVSHFVIKHNLYKNIQSLCVVIASFKLCNRRDLKHINNRTIEALI